MGWENEPLAGEQAALDESVPVDLQLAEDDGLPGGTGAVGTDRSLRW